MLSTYIPIHPNCQPPIGASLRDQCGVSCKSNVLGEGLVPNGCLNSKLYGHVDEQSSWVGKAPISADINNLMVL